MNQADAFLKKLGISFEDLDKPGHMGEKEEYFKLLQNTQENPLTVEKIRMAVLRMKHSVEMELTKPDLDRNTDLMLKARLRNYILLEAFLYSAPNIEETYKNDIDQLVKGK